MTPADKPTPAEARAALDYLASVYDPLGLSPHFATLRAALAAESAAPPASEPCSCCDGRGFGCPECNPGPGPIPGVDEEAGFPVKPASEHAPALLSWKERAARVCEERAAHLRERAEAFAACWRWPDDDPALVEANRAEAARAEAVKCAAAIRALPDDEVARAEAEFARAAEALVCGDEAEEGFQVLRAAYDAMLAARGKAGATSAGA